MAQQLKIWGRHCCGEGSIPVPGTFPSRGCGQKKNKRNFFLKKKREMHGTHLLQDGYTIWIQNSKKKKQNKKTTKKEKS